MKKQILFLILLLNIFRVTPIYSTGEPSTYFNIFVPPNNDAVKRNVCLIVTAIYDSTVFTIVDDNMDGDSDDNVSGVLNAGQSYILYIADNGINDDAKYASGGVLKQDGDYFIITADKIVYASQSTDSDWQHDWLPSVNKSSLGEKFIVYAPKISSSNRDINAMVYSDSTIITLRKISTQPKTNSGYTDVNIYLNNIVFTKVLNKGQDLIYAFTEGRNVLVTGETYVIESSKPITMMYGALYGNERDGGGYVPSSNGTSSGELFYFAVPYQSAGEQEIRVVSWDNANNITIDRFSNGSWISLKTLTLDRLKGGDWVGKSNGNASYPTVFRLRCTAGKKVSVFEANWLETGSPGTSDIATMVSSEKGTCSGKSFLVYMAPPGNEQNVRDPFTGTLFGKSMTHVYLFANDSAQVVVKDAYTNGAKINRTYTIPAKRYVDCYLDLTQWKSIYNGTGTTAGPERPYLLIESSNPISVLNTNFNDNWMMYFGSSLPQAFSQSTTSSKNTANPGDTVNLVSSVLFNDNKNIVDPSLTVIVGSGMLPVSSSFNTSSSSIPGVITTTDSSSQITFNTLPSILNSQNSYTVTTKLVAQISYNNGTPISNNTVANVDVLVSGYVDNVLQQSVSSQGLSITSSNTGNLLFSQINNSTLSTKTNSWTCSWIDYDNDNDDDLFVTTKDKTDPNILYRNNGNKTFTKISNGNLTSDLGPTVTSTWADVDNDGDLDAFVVNNGYYPNALYINTNGIFSNNKISGINSSIGYYHNATWIDYNRDGWLDLFLSNYTSTKTNELYKNNGDGTFTAITSNAILISGSQTIGATWADYDNDMYPDLFIPCNDGTTNKLFHNRGDGEFDKVTTGVIVNDGGYSVGSCWGDYDNDGDLDLFVANASNKDNYLYKNNGSGSFTKITTGIVISDKGHSHGCSWVDIDNDGDLDLYITNDQGKKYLYLNDGVGNFEKKLDEIVSSNYARSYGQSWSDYDKDGDLDLFVVAQNGNNNFLFDNNGNQNKWINIKLVGIDKNLSAIGAKVFVKTAGIWQMREVNCQSGLGGQHSLRSHFGLKTSTLIDTIKVIWPSGKVQYVKNMNANQFITITETAGIELKGKVFHDSNNDCALSVTENVLSQQKINIEPGSIQLTTDANGVFSVNLPAATYTVTLLPSLYWNTSCQAAQTVTLTSGVNANELYFATTQKQNGTDLKVDIGNTALRRGFKGNITLQYENAGTLDASNTSITLALPANIKLISADKAWDSYANNTYHWTISELKAGKTEYLKIVDSLDLSLPINTEIALISTISSSETDLQLANNSITKSDIIVGAIDPNDILVSPKGEGAEGLIQKDQLLTYKVRFQNVGNYFAEKVVIENEIPNNLDISTMQVLSASHAYTYRISGYKTMWTFDNIYLPDSTTNEENSHGYIEYTIYPHRGITNGEQIINSAKIQFDYCDFISTNKVENKIRPIWNNESSLFIYPNPTKTGFTVFFENEVSLKNEDSIIQQLLITTIDGMVVQSYSKINEPNIFVATNQFKPGIYIIYTTDSSGKRKVSRVVVM